MTLPTKVRRAFSVAIAVLLLLVALAPYLGITVLARPFLWLWSGGMKLLAASDRVFPPGSPGQNLNTSERDMFLSTSSVGLALATALSVVLCFWSKPIRAKTATFCYLSLMVVLVSISTANFNAGDMLLNVRAQAVIDLVLVAVASMSVLVLLRIRPETTTGIVVRAIVVFLLCFEGIALPGIYFVIWLLYVQRFVTLKQTWGMNPGWISAMAGLFSAAIAALNYLKAKRDVEQDAQKPKIIRV